MWHSTLACNVVSGLIFQGLLLFGGAGQPLSYWWQPFLVAGLWIADQRGLQFARRAERHGGFNFEMAAREREFDVHGDCVGFNATIGFFRDRLELEKKSAKIALGAFLLSADKF